MKPHNLLLQLSVYTENMHRGNDPEERRTGEASLGAECANHLTNSMYFCLLHVFVLGLLSCEQRPHSADGRIDAETWFRSKHQHGTKKVRENA